MNALPGTSGAFITINGGGSVALTGSTDPFTALAGKIVASSAGSLLLDTNSNATLNMSGYSALFLGAENTTPGQPVVFTGTITPNNNIFRLGTGKAVGGSNGVGLTGSTLVNFTGNAYRDILVLPLTNQLNDQGGAAKSLNIGSGDTYLSSYNTYSGTTSVGRVHRAKWFGGFGIGNDAALGAGNITFSPTTVAQASLGYLGGFNGDHTVDNNVTVAQAGNWVAAANLASDAVANSGAMTYAGKVTLTGAVGIFGRTNNAIFLGDIAAGGTITINNQVSFLTTAAGASNKSYAQATAITGGSTLIIDSNTSLGSGTQTLTIASTSGTGTLKIQPGTSSAITLTGRNVVVGTNFAPTFDIPGSPVTNTTSSLIIPGVVSGGGTALISKIGLGTLTFKGSNTVTGTAANGFQIFGGTVILDSTGGAAAVTTSATMQLTLGSSTTATAATLGGGGTFSMTTGATSTTQTFTNLALGAKDNTISLASTTGAANLTFTGTSFNRGAAGGTLNLNESTGTGTASINLTGTIAASSAASVAGAILLDGGATGNAFAVFNGNDWAARNGSNQIVALGSAGAGTYTANTATALSGNADMTAATPSTVLGTPSTTITSLRFNAAAAETLDLNGNTLVTGGILIGSGSGANDETIQGTGGGTLQGIASKDLVVIQNNTSGSLVISAAIANNTGATALTKSGAGTLVLSGANTFTGSIFLNNGVISVASAGTAAAANPLGQATTGATNLVFNGGTLRYTGADTLANPTVTDRGATFNSFSTIEIADPAGVLSMTQSMVGIALVPGLLQKTGNGTLELSGAVDNTNLSALVTTGTLDLDKASTSAIHALGGGTGGAALIVNTNGTVRITGSGGDQISNGSAVVVNGNGKFDLNSQSETIDALAGTGTVTNNGTSGVAITLTLGDNTVAGSQANNGANTLNAANAGVAGTGLNNFSGLITDNGGVNTLALTKAGPGTQILSSAGNSYSGDTTISSGTLLLRATDALPHGNTKGNVKLTGNTVIFGVTVPGILDIGGFNQTINGLSSSGGGIVTNTPLSSFSTNQTATLTVGDNNVSSTFDGVFQDGYVIHPGTTPTGVFGILAVTKTGLGVLTLTGASTNTGLVTVNQGELDLGDVSANALATNVTVSGGVLKLLASNQLLDTKTVVISSGSFDINGANETVGVSLTGGAILDSAGGGTLSSPLAAFDLQSGTVSAALGGASGLTKTTVGTVTLTNVNSYGGATNVTGGILVVDVGWGDRHGPRGAYRLYQCRPAEALIGWPWGAAIGKHLSEVFVLVSQSGAEGNLRTAPPGDDGRELHHTRRGAFRAGAQWPARARGKQYCRDSGCRGRRDRLCGYFPRPDHPPGAGKGAPANSKSKGRKPSASKASGCWPAASRTISITCSWP
ncbi:MAG: autotransporter-associated beta strand repeat-containing protein [Chthoniobacter sp.]